MPSLAALSQVTSAYRGADYRASLFQLANTLIPLTVLYWAGTHWVSVAPLLCIPAAIVCGGLVVRAFNLQHDCSHRSFFRSKAANDLTGFLIGILTMTPHACWRRFHNTHHAGNGNLEKRGFGDVKTLTVNEYLSLSRLQKLTYRFYRHPLTLFVFGAFAFFLIRQRLTYYIPREWKRERISVHATNLGLLLAAGAVFAFADDPWNVLAFHSGVMLIATGFGVWLYYIQHQFPCAYWRLGRDWNIDEAALHGSSFYDLPRALHWMTANIGYHHIHHVDVSIPNYRLPVCHAAQYKELEPRARFTLLESFGFSRLKLWDENSGRMIGFSELSLQSAITAR
jgi:omega-6 fatty acid desaturase (delta-12 desaturase)